MSAARASSRWVERVAGVSSCIPPGLLGLLGLVKISRLEGVAPAKLVRGVLAATQRQGWLLLLLLVLVGGSRTDPRRPGADEPGEKMPDRNQLADSPNATCDSTALPGALSIPRHEWGSEEAFASIAEGRPCILSGIPLVSAVAGKWTIPYLTANFSSESYTVYASTSERFRYWSQDKRGCYQYEPPTEIKNMSFGDFVAQMHGCSDDPRMLYFQQALVVGVGEQILQDFQQLDLETAVVLKQLGNWKELTTNLLLVAPRGAVTPAHYDEQENVFAQIHGRKHIRLFPPEEFARMFPFPLDHPGDRQSQLEIPAAQEGGLRLPPTNGDRFPNFPRREYACTLEEGEVLYMPAYWWHQIESLTDNVSMTWWFKCADQQVGGEDGRVRLGERSKAALRRNVERLLGQLVAAEATGHAAHAFFRALETQEGISPEDFSPDAAVVTRPDLPEQWPTAISTVSKMLQLVLDSDEIVPFVRELVARRFAHLDVDA